MAESCNEEGRGDDVARGIHTLSEFAASETCSGGAASLVATKGATTSWFAQPDQAELMQGAVKESFAVSEGCYVSMLKNEFGAELIAVCPGQNFARGGEPCAAACEMTRETLKKLRAMAESCNEEGRGDDVARGIHTLSEFAASETCSGGAASLVATKGATTSWFAQPDQAELTQ